MIDESFFDNPDERLDRDRVRRSLEGWEELNDELPDLTLREMYAVMRLECVQLQRRAHLRRLMQRIRATAADAVESFLLNKQAKWKP